MKHEARTRNATPGETALELASRKAISVDRPCSIVIGCDQILVCGETWFDKPESLQAARGHLKSLRGRTHVLETATVVLRDGAEIWRHLATPRLTMRAFSDAFLDEYVAAEGTALLGSVGAYRLEGLGIHLFDAIDGDQSAIMGLPLLPLLGFLRGYGILAG